MTKVTFIEQDGTHKEVDAPENWSLMQIAVEHKIKGIEGSCGGSVACATCHCYIHPEWVTRVNSQDNEQSAEEEDLLDTATDVRETSRLGCQVKITSSLDGLIVGLPGTTKEPF